MFDPRGQRAYVAADLGMVESALRAVSPSSWRLSSDAFAATASRPARDRAQHVPLPLCAM